MKIGYLGPQGSYSYDAVNLYKKDGDELLEFVTIV